MVSADRLLRRFAHSRGSSHLNLRVRQLNVPGQSPAKTAVGAGVTYHSSRERRRLPCHFPPPTNPNRHVGRLGCFTFRRGDHVYVGSAQRNLKKRLAHHGRRRKGLRWQINGLSVKAPLVGALVLL